MTFTETQKFAPLALWLMRGALVFLLLVFLYSYRSTGYHYSYWFYIFAVLPMLLLEVLRLKTKIDESGIHMNFVPFSKKHYGWDDIKSAKVLDYGFVGGWGIRMRTKYGTVYNTQGREGVWLKLKNDKQVLIGTQRKHDLQRALDKHFTRP
jgi:hypothetical protein